MKKNHTVISLLLVAILSAGIIFFSNLMYKQGPLAVRVNKNVVYEKAKVVTVKSEKLNKDPYLSGINTGYQEIQIEMLTGKYKGEIYNVRNAMSRLYNVHTKEGMTVIVSVYFKNDQISDISVYSYRRSPVIYSLAALFFAIIILIGKIKGVKSVAALVFTGVMVVFFMAPLILNGADPILMATITAIVTTVVSLYLISGWGKKTVTAMIGTISGVIIAGGLAFAAGNLAHLSGMTMDNAENLIYIAENSKFSIRGLMYSAILIASLGAVMDMGMSIASAIFEMHSIKPTLTKKELFQSGMNVGKDVIGTMSNTLILAFAGSSLPLIILIMASNMPYLQLINLDIICTELIQGLSGSIGIVLTVPVTAGISAFLIGSDVKVKKGVKRQSRKAV
jgi:uncharacterized membrane protein